MVGIDGRLVMNFQLDRATKRMIWTSEKERSKANEIANWLRGRGFSTRVYERTLSAEGISLLVYVVVTDVAAFAAHPSYQLPGVKA